jgi:arsenate reductase
VSRRLKRVLFVCIGNSCRSQMAEGFARAYGSDVMIPASAGLAPATRIAADTVDAMDEKGIDLRDHFPKAISHLGRVEFDLVINISGRKLPPVIYCPVLEWDVADPVSLSYEDHCAIRDELERLVMELILQLRREQYEPALKPSELGKHPL